MVRQRTDQVTQFRFDLQNHGQVLIQMIWTGPGLSTEPYPPLVLLQLRPSTGVVAFPPTAVEESNPRGSLRSTVSSVQ